MTRDPSPMLTTAVPFEEAAAFLAGKPAVSRALFDRLLPELKARAFVITGVNRMDAVAAAREAIAEIPRGADWDVQKKAIVAKLEPWLGEGAEVRTEMLMRWHGYQAYAVANKANLDANTDLFPYRQYQTAQDGRVRDTHAALNGLVLPADSKFWDRHTPPWEYGCRCDVRGVTAEEAGEIAAEDAGKPEEKRRVLEGPIKEQLEQFGRLQRGINELYDVRTPSERGESGVEWGSKDLTIPMDALEKRYSPEDWLKWKAWAEGTQIEGLGSVWEWLAGTATVAAPAAPIAAATAATNAAQLVAAIVQHRADFPPVSNAFTEVRGRGATRKHIPEAAAVIDDLHGDGQLLPLSLSGKTDSRYAGFLETWPTGGVLNVNPSGHWPRLTATHELGHALDFYAFGTPALSAAEASAEFASWRQIVGKSDAIAILEKLPLPKKNRDYLLSHREIWARSYAQWVAVRSGDPVLIADLERRLAMTTGQQWAQKDFEPVAEAIDQIFERRGWLRPRATPAKP